MYSPTKNDLNIRLNSGFNKTQSITRGRSESLWGPGSHPKEPKNTWDCGTLESGLTLSKISFIEHDVGFKKKSGRACDPWTRWLPVSPSSSHKPYARDSALTHLWCWWQNVCKASELRHEANVHTDTQWASICCKLLQNNSKGNFFFFYLYLWCLGRYSSPLI